MIYPSQAPNEDGEAGERAIRLSLNAVVNLRWEAVGMSGAGF